MPFATSTELKSCEARSYFSSRLSEGMALMTDQGLLFCCSHRPLQLLESHQQPPSEGGQRKCLQGLIQIHFPVISSSQYSQHHLYTSPDVMPRMHSCKGITDPHALNALLSGTRSTAGCRMLLHNLHRSTVLRLGLSLVCMKTCMHLPLEALALMNQCFSAICHCWSPKPQSSSPRHCWLAYEVLELADNEWAHSSCGCHCMIKHTSCTSLVRENACNNAQLPAAESVDQ